MKKKTDAPVAYDEETGKWVPVPGYKAADYSATAFSDDASDQSWRDADTASPSDLDNKLYETPPVPPQPVNPIIASPGAPSVGGALPFVSSPSLAPRANGSNYAPLRGSNEPAPPGLAFDTNRMLTSLANSCSETTGSCLHNVADAMLAGGYNMRTAIDKARAEGIAPRHAGSYWAKDMIPVLDHDPHFKHVAEGFGAKTNAEYVPKIGDIAVWQGGQTGPYGHIQVCIGFDANGVARWRSDFTTSASNWTGMRDPAAHGGNFVVYRQEPAEPVVAQAKPEIKSSEKPAVAANAPPKPVTAPQPAAV